MKKLKLNLQANRLTAEQMKKVRGGDGCTTKQFDGVSVTCCNNTVPCQHTYGGVNSITCDSTCES